MHHHLDYFSCCYLLLFVIISCFSLYYSFIHTGTDEKQSKKKPAPTPPKMVEGGSDRDRARILLSEALGNTGEDDDEGLPPLSSHISCVY